MKGGRTLVNVPNLTVLQQNIINAGHCTTCGACVLACPSGRPVVQIDKPDEALSPVGTCPINEQGRCGLCAYACPRLETEMPEVNGRAGTYGSFLRIAVARTTNKAIAKRCQDGGLVTTLLACGLDSGVWKTALVSGRDEEWRCVPFVATKLENLLSTAGSRYTYSPVSTLLQNQPHCDQPFAIVGLPCQVAGIRRLQKLKVKQVRSLQLIVGLFCSETFQYEGLVQETIQGKLGISPRQISKMDIKGQFIVELDSGERYEVPLKEIKKHSRPACHSCNDFAAEQADISTGGLGLQGWTLVLVRTPMGESIMNHAEQTGLLEVKSIDEFPQAMLLLEKLSERKKRPRK